MSTPVFFYVLSGKKYIEEARRSARSVKRAMPDSHTILFTPDNVEDKGVFGDVIRVANTRLSPWFLAQALHIKDALLCMEEDSVVKCIFLDCDTWVAHPVYELFDLLDEYDYFGTHAPGRRTCGTLGEAPECFPEINTGVNGFRIGQRTIALADRCFKLHEAHRTLYGNNDQGPLRDALWWTHQEYEHFRWYVIPPEYNLRFNMPCFVRNKVKILHGYHDDIEEVARRANESEDLRSWPKGGICP